MVGSFAILCPTWERAPSCELSYMGLWKVRNLLGLRVFRSSVFKPISLLNRSTHQHQHSALIKRYSQLKNRDWEVIKIQHIYREANKAANFLANMS
ncbi:hypothetical protein LINPERHAP1_LOCUS26095 [Linum perenne]